MRFLNLILILLLWTEAVFAVSTTDNNKVVGKTLKVASEYVTSMSKIDGSFESGNTGWVASVGTITPTASTEFQGNYKGVWSATGAGTLDLQWTATASNTYEASAIVSVDAADSDHYVCAVVNGVETGCTLFDGPDYTPNKQIKVSVVADSVKAASFYLRIKHTGTDAFNLSIDDGKIQPWTAQTVQTVEQGTTYHSAAASTLVQNTAGAQLGFTLSNFSSTGDFSNLFNVVNESNVTKFYAKKNLIITHAAINSYSSSANNTISIWKNGSNYISGVQIANATFNSAANAPIPLNSGEYISFYTAYALTSAAPVQVSISAQALRNNVVQAWQQPGDIGEIKYLPQNVAPNGFIPANGITIGNSGATYTGAQYLALYKVLWSIATTTSTDPYYISSAKGSSADADWAANKTIKIDESGLFTRAYKSGVTNGVGQKQDDAFQGHQHTQRWPNYTGGRAAYNSDGPGVDPGYGATIGIVTDGTNGTPRIASETRPMNVAKYVFIRYAVSTPALLALPTSKDNHKTYDQSLVSVTGTGWTTTKAVFRPIRTISKVTGAPVWVLDFNIHGTTSTSVSTITIGVAGVTFSGSYQATAASAGSVASGYALNSSVVGGSGNISMGISVSSSSSWAVSGTAEITGKPTWADDWVDPGVFVGNVPLNWTYPLTVTASDGSTGFTAGECFGTVEKTGDGKYWLSFTITGTATAIARTEMSVTVSGVTTTAGAKAISWMLHPFQQTGTALWFGSSGRITIYHPSATIQDYTFSGRVLLASKPTWATNTP